MAKKKENIETPEQIEVLANIAAAEAIAEGNIEATEVPKEEKKEKKKAKKSSENNDPKKKKPSFRDLIDGSILTRDYVVGQLPFIFFVTILVMFYIANKYHSEKMAREAEIIQKELKELRSEKLSVQSELMSMSKQSKVIELIEEKNMDLKQLVEPPKKIILMDNSITQKTENKN